MEWAPRPAQVPRLRRQTAQYTRTPLARRFAEYFAQTGKGVVIPAPTAADSAELAVTGEYARLRDAELFFVTPEMVDLVSAAFATLPEFAPRRADFPTESGFIVFGKPLASRPLDHSELALAAAVNGQDGVDRMLSVPETPVVAAAWGPYISRPHWAAGGGVFINFYSPRSIVLAVMAPGQAGRIKEAMPPLLNENEAAFALLPPPGVPLPPGFTADEYTVRQREPNDFSSGGDGSGGHVGPWTRMLLATLILMQQPGLAGAGTAAAPRDERRSTARAGLPVRDVRVVQLRRPAREAGADAAIGAATDRTWHHAWIVRGHWRNQAYGPGRAQRRPTWIAPYTKGPEGAPLLGGEKVNVWAR